MCVRINYANSGQYSTSANAIGRRHIFAQQTLLRNTANAKLVTIYYLALLNITPRLLTFCCYMDCCSVSDV